MIGLLFLLTCGCAHVTFHPSKDGGDSPDTGRESGVKFYTPKPYVLVGPSGNKDVPLKVELVYLPDLEHPTYAIFHPGLGSAKQTLNIAANGTLASFNQEMDSKVPETMNAVGSMVSSLATGLKTAGIVAQAAEEDAAAAALKSALGKLRIITTELDQQTPLVKAIQGDVVSAQSDLSAVLKKVEGGDHDQQGAIQAVVDKLNALDLRDTRGSPETVVKQVREAIEGAVSALQRAIAKLGQSASAPTDFRLYEVQSAGGTVRLIQVR